jgi:hypothetical protein
MFASRPVEVQGRFLGVAVTHEAAWRFVAVRPSLADIDGATFPIPAEARRVAELMLARCIAFRPRPRIRPDGRAAHAVHSRPGTAPAVRRLRLTAEALMPVLARLAGVASASMQAVHPPATAHEHDPALVALLVL